MMKHSIIRRYSRTRVRELAEVIADTLDEYIKNIEFLSLEPELIYQVFEFNNTLSVKDISIFLVNIRKVQGDYFDIDDFLDHVNVSEIERKYIKRLVATMELKRNMKSDKNIFARVNFIEDKLSDIEKQIVESGFDDRSDSKSDDSDSIVSLLTEIGRKFDVQKKQMRSLEHTLLKTMQSQTDGSYSKSDENSTFTCNSDISSSGDYSIKMQTVDTSVPMVQTKKKNAIEYKSFPRTSSVPPSEIHLSDISIDYTSSSSPKPKVKNKSSCSQSSSMLDNSRQNMSFRTVSFVKSADCSRNEVETSDFMKSELYIFRYCESGDLKSLQNLVRNNPDLIDHRDKVSGQTPLHRAAHFGHRDLCEFLINGGADVNSKQKDGYIPLHLASSRGFSGVVSLLLQRGAAINEKGLDGKTPLHRASFNGYQDICKILVGSGACVNEKDSCGRTPLHLAFRNGHKNLSEFLIRSGAVFK